MRITPADLVEILDTEPEKPGEPVSLEHRRVLKKFGIREFRPQDND